MTFNLKKNIFLKNFLSILAIVFFGFTMFSIPFFSFRPRLNLITWFFTIGFTAFIVLYIFIYKKVEIDVVICSLLLFILCAFFASALSMFRNFSLSIILNTSIIMILYMFCKNERKKAQLLLISTFIGIVVFGFTYFLQYRAEILSLDFSRLGSMFGDVNDIGIILCLATAIGFSLVFLVKRIYVRILLIIGSIFTAFLSFTSGSKICLFLIAGISFAAIIVFFGKKRWYLSLISIVLVTVLFVILIQIPAFSTMKNRIDEMIYTLTGLGDPTIISYSSVIRFDMFKGGISLFLRRPLFGFGINGYETYAGYPDVWSHNHISDSLSNFGVIGSLFYHLPFAVSFINSKKERKNSPLFIILAFSSISLLSTVLFREKFFTFIIGIVISFADNKTWYSIDLSKRFRKDEN